MSNHGLSWLLLVASECSRVLMGTHECSLLLMISHNQPWKHGAMSNHESSHEYGAMGLWALISTHKHSEAAKRSQECSWLLMTIHEETWILMTFTQWSNESTCGSSRGVMIMEACSLSSIPWYQYSLLLYCYFFTVSALCLCVSWYQGMAREPAVSGEWKKTRLAIWLSWPNRHGVAFPFPTSGVPKTSVSRRYPFLISFLTCDLPCEDKFWAAATRVRDNLCNVLLVDFPLGNAARSRIFYARSWADTVLKTCLQSTSVKVSLLCSIWWYLVFWVDFMSDKRWRQAGAELGQSQIKLRLDFILIELR